MPVLPLVASTIVPPGPEHAAPLGVLDHRGGDAILDAAARVAQLQLAEETRTVLADPPQLDERRPADGGVHAAVEHQRRIVTRLWLKT